MSLDSLNHVFQWDDKLTSVISEHRAYYFLMVNKLFEWDTGPTTKIPKPPKRKLQDVFNDKLDKKKKKR